MSRDNRLLAFSLLVWGMGEGMFYFIRPLYLKELGADPVAIGSILSLAFLANALTHIPAGYLADRFGRKQVLVAGWVLGIAAGAVMFLARDLTVFIAGMLVYGFTGFVVAPINAYATEARGGQSVQRALTLVSAGYWAGNIASPAIGGLLGREFGLRSIYGFATALFVLSTLALLPLRAQPVTPHHPGRSRYGPLLANRRFVGFLALMFVALAAMQLGLPFMPNFVVEARGFDVSVVGVLGSLNSLGAVLLMLAVGQRLPRRAFLFAQALLAVALALTLASPGLGWLAAAYFLQGSWTLARNMVSAQVGRVVGPAEMGLAYGITETVSAAVMVTMPLLAGVLYEQGRALPFQASLALIVLTLPLVWWLAPRRDQHTVEAPPRVESQAGGGDG